MGDQMRVQKGSGWEADRGSTFFTDCTILFLNVAQKGGKFTIQYIRT